MKPLSIWQSLSTQMQQGSIKALARCISLVENEVEGYDDFLKNLAVKNTPVIGITGPPGAGKSTLTDALIEYVLQQNKKVALLCVDPSSPFNMGALLGDRIRMSSLYNEPNVYIRSLATRGSLGGLNPKIIEITEVLKIADFDYIFIETVGVGQSEIEIAGLADATVVVLVPESGDEIQTMKAGLMEVADVFVVNKADRPGAKTFVKNLHLMLSPAFSKNEHEIAIITTIATKKEGVKAVYDAICENLLVNNHKDKRYHLLAEKAYLLLQQKRMKGISKKAIFEELKAGNIDNVYQYIAAPKFNN